MNVNTKKVLHVSSYPQYDLEPADQLGIKTICIDRYGYNWREKIPTIDKLLDRVKK
jgi:FMN phosphatase YigB (HAD superfamily)